MLTSSGGGMTSEHRVKLAVPGVLLIEDDGWYRIKHPDGRELGRQRSKSWAWAEALRTLNGAS